ncbi:MAG TPA: sigma-54-dependent Fis family transcriptional regulator, partial [Firmicutes bacterium]|nr:sigma-54-dependent Fis family transcriptional regulator [Bacillota bacterium]
PGNVRELEHAIEGALNITDQDVIELSQLPAHLVRVECYRPGVDNAAVTLQPGQTLP